MFRRKGLFWYNPKTSFRLFDWSTVIDSSGLGNQHSTLGKKIKNLYKKQHTVYQATNHNYIKSHLKGLHVNYPQLDSFDFFLLDDIQINRLIFISFFFCEKIELKLDALLDSLIIKQSKNSNSVLVTDFYLAFNNYTPKKTDDTIVYVNHLFPILPITLELFKSTSTILVGGKHPFNLNGQKLVITRNPTLINSIKKDLFHQPNLWHLNVYKDAIHLFQRKQKHSSFKKRYKIFLEEIKNINAYIQKKIPTGKILTHNSICTNQKSTDGFLGFLAKIIIPFKNKSKVKSLLATPKLQHLKEVRIFLYDQCIHYQQSNETIELFIHLPIDFDEHHLKNKSHDLLNIINYLSTDSTDKQEKIAY